MSTTRQSVTTGPATTMSVTANTVLNCFTDGLDGAVSDLAKQFAMERTRSSGPAATIEIKVDDVRRAAELVIKTLKEKIESGSIPKEWQVSIDEVEGRLDEKANEID